jgi:hypothetical protein
MLRLWRWIAQRARESPNAYAMLAGALLAVALPMYLVLFAMHADEATGIPAIDAILRPVYAVLGEIFLATLWISIPPGLLLIFLGAMGALSRRNT